MLTKLSVPFIFVLISASVYASVSDEVIAITKQQWAAEMANAAVSKQTVLLSEDYTEFNPQTPFRINGKAMNVRLWEAVVTNDKGKLISAEMVNEKVQSYDNTAILTYNFVGAYLDKDGKITPILAKSTRVYVKNGKSWKMVHANFSPVKTNAD